MEQHCTYRTGSVAARPASYLRFCEIREGAYQQKCHGDAYSTATCFDPVIIKGRKPATCQTQFIQERFSRNKNPTTLLLNCAKGKYPKRTDRDARWESEYRGYDEISYSSHPVSNFKLTR